VQGRRAGYQRQVVPWCLLSLSKAWLLLFCLLLDILSSLFPLLLTGSLGLLARLWSCFWRRFGGVCTTACASWLLIVVDDVVYFASLGDVRDELDWELAAIGVHLLLDLRLLDGDWPQKVL